jgi:hypothetical protein
MLLMRLSLAMLTLSAALCSCRPPPRVGSAELGASEYSVSGVVEGLVGTGLVLVDHFGQQVAVSKNGPFRLDLRLRTGARYEVRVAAQPTLPQQRCTIVNGQGTVSNEDIGSLVVTCVKTQNVTVNAVGLIGSVQAQLTDAVTLELTATSPTANVDIAEGVALKLAPLIEALQPKQSCVVEGVPQTPLAAPVTVTVTCLTLVPYFDVAANLGSYVSRSAAAIWQEPTNQTACAASDVRCWHAGEARRVTLPMLSDCTGVTAEDDLGGLDWRCDDKGLGVRLVSTRVKNGLANLLDFSKQRVSELITLTIRTPTATLYASAKDSWTNPVLFANNGGVLAQPGAIYLVNSTGVPPITLAADSVSLVVSPGVAMSTYNLVQQSTLVQAAGRRYLWIEGSFFALANERGIDLSNIKHARLVNLGVYGANNCVSCPSVGLALSQSSAIEARELRIASVGTTTSADDGTGLLLDTVTDSVFDGVRIAAIKGAALSTLTSSRNIWSRIVVSNSSRAAEGSGQNNIFSDVLLANNGDGTAVHTGEWNFSSQRNNIISDLTATNSYYGVRIGTLNTLQRALFYDHFTPLRATAQNTVSDVAVAAASDVAVNFSNRDNFLTGQFIHDDAITCAGDPLNGISDTPCANTSASNAVFAPLLAAAGNNPVNTLFVAAADTDARNYLVSGKPSGSITDLYWTDFASPWRVWASLLTTTCAGSACRMRDFRLRTSANGSVITESLPRVSNAVIRHVWGPTTQATCAAIPGASFDSLGCRGPLVYGSNGSEVTCLSTVAPGPVCASIFVRNMREVSADGIGNDNFLCEKNEHCVHTPNLGAYQGEGELQLVGPLPTGSFPIDAAGITTFATATNGL